MSAAKQQAESQKLRKSLSLSDEVLGLGEQLAQGENRNFSNYIETLILRDAGRLNSAVPIAPSDLGSEAPAARMTGKEISNSR